MGQMFIHLEDFCMNRSQEGEADILLRGLVWNNEHHHHFRLQDFLQFLERKRFQEFGASKISSILRDYGAHHVGVNVRKGKFVNVYKVKQFAVDLEFEPPKQTGDIPY